MFKRPQLRCSFVWRHASLTRHRCLSTSGRKLAEETFSTAPKPRIDVKSIRSDPERHSQNCIDRNYTHLSPIPRGIITKHAAWLANEKASAEDRRLVKELEPRIRDADEKSRDELLKEIKRHKDALTGFERQQDGIQNEISSSAEKLPNLMSKHTPIGTEPRVLKTWGVLPDDPNGDRDHVRIGDKLGILDFGAAGTTSGWGFYFLLDDGARLEHALIQHALEVARHRGFTPCTPPSLIYTDIGAACGFRPRDQNGEQQVYTIHPSGEESEPRKPTHSLAGTAEIPFAAMRANTVMEYKEMPRRLVGSSRCYRAEAGARGREARGLYRVHEFTKVEMFAWTLPSEEEEIFHDMVSVQREILGSLDLPYRVLEISSHDLGASASRKHDIEVYFPSRKGINDGWGEVTSTSICTDYQTRRLNTKVRMPPGSSPSLAFPSTVNGTALAVPRVLAAILENGCRGGEVAIPEVLWPYMNGQKLIPCR